MIDDPRKGWQQLRALYNDKFKDLIVSVRLEKDGEIVFGKDEIMSIFYKFGCKLLSSELSPDEVDILQGNLKEIWITSYTTAGHVHFGMPSMLLNAFSTPAKPMISHRYFMVSGNASWAPEPARSVNNF